MELKNYTTIDIKSTFHKMQQEIIDLKNTLKDLTELMLRKENKSDLAIRSLGIENREIETQIKQIHQKLESQGIRVWDKEDCNSIYY